MSFVVRVPTRIAPSPPNGPRHLYPEGVPSGHGPADGIGPVTVVVRSRDLVEGDLQIARGCVHGVGEPARRTRGGITEVVIGVRARHRVVAHDSPPRRRPDVLILTKLRDSGRCVGPGLARIELAIEIDI